MILIVDDDNAVRMSVSLALKRAGYEPWAVGNEDDALAAVRDERVILVILDMNLTLSTTGRQGVEMLRKIRILRPEIPVIMITAWGTIPQAVTTMAYGATTLDEMESEAISEALRRCGGNLSEAAKQLGITRQSLYRRIEKYKL